MGIRCTHVIVMRACWFLLSQVKATRLGVWCMTVCSVGTSGPARHGVCRCYAMLVGTSAYDSSGGRDAARTLLNGWLMVRPHHPSTPLPPPFSRYLFIMDRVHWLPGVTRHSPLRPWSLHLYADTRSIQVRLVQTNCCWHYRWTLVGDEYWVNSLFE